MNQKLVKIKKGTPRFWVVTHMHAPIASIYDADDYELGTDWSAWDVALYRGYDYGVTEIRWWWDRFEGEEQPNWDNPEWANHLMVCDYDWWIMSGGRGEIVGLAVSFEHAMDLIKLYELKRYKWKRRRYYSTPFQIDLWESRIVASIPGDDPDPKQTPGGQRYRIERHFVHPPETIQAETIKRMTDEPQEETLKRRVIDAVSALVAQKRQQESDES